MFRILPVLGAAVVIAAMSVAPASAGGRQVIHNAPIENSTGWGWWTAAGARGLYPDSSLVELYGTPYAVPKHVIAYWPRYGWYRR
jgi:hypothetical protein